MDNFKNKYGVILERKAITCFYNAYTGEDLTKIYHSNNIETGKFAEVLILVIYKIIGYSNECEEANCFIEECKKYIGVNTKDIKDEVIDSICNEFEKLWNKYNKCNKEQ